MGTANRASIIAFTAGKGGCGKTTLAINFGNVLQNFGTKVLVIDFDLNNQGASGTFSEFIHKTEGDYVTTHDLLWGDDLNQPVVSIKDKLLFLPAQRPSDEPSARLEYDRAQSAAAQLRERIQALAEKHGVDCVVLDCFCGIDPMTTASIGAADHALLVNEPDLVTFTGTLAMFRHLTGTYAFWERSPRLHIIVNRVRPPQTVKSLVTLYRDNLAREIPEGVACYFPYNERIFRNFGRHPLPSDLLPGSLFVDKLKLLAFILFNDNHPQLLSPKLRSWSKRDVRKLFLRSIDPAAVDAETLVLRLTRFPLLFMLWLPMMLGARSLSDPSVLPLTLAIVVFLAIVVVFPLVRGYWSAARFNWTMAAFLWRVAPFRKSNAETALDRMQAGFNGLLSIALFSFVAVIVVLTGVASVMLAEEVLEAENDATAAVQLSLQSGARVVDVSGETIDGKYELNWSRDLSNRKGTTRGSVANGTTFRNVVFKSQMLNDSQLVGTEFDRCVFEPESSSSARSTAQNAEQEDTVALRIQGAKLSDVEFKEPLVARDVHYRRLSFANSHLDGVSLELRAGTRVELANVTIGAGKLEVENLDASIDGPDNAEPELLRSVVISTRQDLEGKLDAGPGVVMLRQTNTVDGRYLDEPTFDELTQEIEKKKLAIGLLSSGGQSQLVERANLIELQLMRGTAEDLTSVKRDLETLGRFLQLRQKDSKPTGRRIFGYHIMLKLLHHLVAAEPRATTAKASKDWARWLHEARDEQSTEWVWGWGSWHEEVINRLPRNDPHRHCYGLVEQSADAKLSPLEFDKRFDDECLDALSKGAE